MVANGFGLACEHCRGVEGVEQGGEFDGVGWGVCPCGADLSGCLDHFFGAGFGVYGVSAAVSCWALVLNACRMVS